ncbi:MAG TPA: sigma factor-like helix-turn-helix DNA-binding protein [Marmoricola sp.]|nr:sigma factor-like helix-turn-helix DNA-binding protein [Marmoricola sp.]
MFELTVVDGLTIADTAQVLGLEPGTVRVRLHRARRQLGAALSDHRTQAVPREAST